ncbi:MAG: hypothetical protein S0880_34995 [Actinomycetota bacterium]|nr:hypothetical protein [Actinomycetota bacterium]
MSSADQPRRADAGRPALPSWSPRLQRLLGWTVVAVGIVALVAVGAEIGERSATRAVAIGTGGVVLIALGLTMTVAHTVVHGAALIVGGLAALLFAGAAIAVVIDDLRQVFLLVPAGFALRAAPGELRLGARTLVGTTAGGATDGPDPTTS